MSNVSDTYIDGCVRAHTNGQNWHHVLPKVITKCNFLYAYILYVKQCQNILVSIDKQLYMF